MLLLRLKLLLPQSELLLLLQLELLLLVVVCGVLVDAISSSVAAPAQQHAEASLLLL